jgi:hypothetical protein
VENVFHTPKPVLFFSLPLHVGFPSFAFKGLGAPVPGPLLFTGKVVKKWKRKKGYLPSGKRGPLHLLLLSNRYDEALLFVLRARLPKCIF